MILKILISSIPWFWLYASVLEMSWGTVTTLDLLRDKPEVGGNYSQIASYLWNILKLGFPHLPHFNMAFSSDGILTDTSIWYIRQKNSFYFKVFKKFKTKKQYE